MSTLQLGRSVLIVTFASIVLAGCWNGNLTPAARAVPLASEPAAPRYKVLHSFNGQDGEAPLASLTELNGTLYGTTSLGGTHGDGTVFSITTTGKERVLHSFGATTSDGIFPAAGLIALNGALFGTTANGGASTNGGVFFRIATNGSERVLFSFANSNRSGAFPAAGLVAVNGILYSTTDWGGRYQFFGTAFSMTTSGRERRLYSFGHPYLSDGAFPSTGLIDTGGVLYGTTLQGGVYGRQDSCSGPCPGYGTVFSISNGDERVVHSFGNGSDGAAPSAPLTNANGTLYGTTYSGGAYPPPYGAGIVFRIDRTGSDTERVLYRFKGGADGSGPAGALIYVRDRFYGTTQNGGSYGGYGTIFRLNPDGSDEGVLHSFGADGDGREPVAGMIAVNGTFYGTTSKGGAYGKGTVFALTP